MKLSFHLHLPSFKLFADDFNELSDAVDFVTLTAGFAMEQWREVQVKILIDGKTSHEDDTRLDTVILAVHGVIIRSFGEPVLRQQVRQSVQDRPDNILEKIRVSTSFSVSDLFCRFRYRLAGNGHRNDPDTFLSVP